MVLEDAPAERAVGEPVRARRDTGARPFADDRPALLPYRDLSGNELVARLYVRQARSSLVFAVAGWLATAIILVGKLPYYTGELWTAVIGLFIAMQAWKRYRGRQRKMTEARADRLLANAPRLAAFSGVSWGITALAVPLVGELERAVLTIITFAMVAAASATLSVVPRAALWFMGTAAIPYLAAHFLVEEGINVALVTLSVLYLAAMMISLRGNMENMRAEVAVHEAAARMRAEVMESRSASARFQELWRDYSGSVEAFALYDEQCRLLLWNDAYRRLLGVAPNALSEGVKLGALEPQDGAMLAEFRQFEQKGRLDTPVAETVERGGRWYRCVIAPVESGHVVVTHTDVSELKGNEQKLLSLRDILVAERNRAEGANRAKSDFLAKMSHELRTPLNAVIGFADLMVQDYDRGRYEKQRHSGYARLISDSGRHLLAIVDDLLDLTQAETGRVPIREGEIEVVDLVRTARQIVEARHSGRQVAFIETYPETAVDMWADRRLLKQALLNLIENSVKFSPEPAVIRITVSTGEEGEVQISIGDNGIGIPEEKLAQVQESFVQLETSEARQFGGLGLGLSLVREFVKLHGGTLALESEVGTGTTATISLPGSRRLAA